MLGQNVIDDVSVNVGKTEVSACVMECQLLVVESHQV